MKLVSKTNASSVVHPVHGSVHADADGLFEVGPEFGAELLRFSGQWALPPDVFAERDVVDVGGLHDPTLAAEVLALLREDVAILRAGGVLEPAAVPSGPWSPDSRTLAWVGMAIRNDREGIAAWTALTHEIAELQARAATDKAKAETTAKAAK